MRQLALFSTYHKEGIGSLARSLASLGMEIVATGKTRELLIGEGLKVIDISELTGEPERFGGRIKTLHHKVMGGILFRPGQDEAEWPFDFRISAVVCNFYPFKEKAEGCQNIPELMEWVDIGGPTMVRAAAKNFKHVWVFTRPDQFTRFIASPGGSISEPEDDRMRERFALQAFEMVKVLDGQISEEFQWRHTGQNNEGKLVYGENPQQAASFLPNLNAGLKMIGKPSFNNLRDAEAALRFVIPFAGPAVSIIKHQTLCGAAAGLKSSDVNKVFEWAWEGDTVSRFGCVMAMNFVPTAEISEIVRKRFIEVLVIPRSEASLQWAKSMNAEKERLRIILVEANLFGTMPNNQESFQGVMGKLTQDSDQISGLDTDKDPRKLFDVLGEWTAACSKSNAITMCGYDEKTGCAYLAGAGQGQPNRVDALKLLAIPRAMDFAKRREVPFESLACFSDGFIPFPDSLRELHAAGLRRLVQPGGSKADPEIIKTAQELGIEMRLTGTRRFWH